MFMTGMALAALLNPPQLREKKVIFLHLFQKKRVGDRERKRETTATGESRGFMSMRSKGEEIVFAGFLVCQMFHVAPGPWNFRFLIFTFVERKHAGTKKRNTF